MRNGFDSPAGGIDDADKSPRRKGNSCNDESQGNRPVVPAMPIVTALAGRSLASERQKPPIRRPSQNLGINTRLGGGKRTGSVCGACPECQSLLSGLGSRRGTHRGNGKASIVCGWSRVRLCLRSASLYRAHRDLLSLRGCSKRLNI